MSCLCCKVLYFHYHKSLPQFPNTGIIIAVIQVRETGAHRSETACLHSVNVSGAGATTYMCLFSVPSVPDSTSSAIPCPKVFETCLFPSFWAFSESSAGLKSQG